ncbi:MAG: SAM-dependent chlorinase/fluorinase [Deltaproteobacteria bacterium]|nr:SAM-dependent chlorinase/fluorinase [Deltaproteobacteria bacterium]
MKRKTSREKKAVITLTTDFGLKDPYQAAMKGAILTVNPGAVIVDVTHLVAHCDIAQGALMLDGAYRWFPPGTIHVAVVDPGVGGKRRAILVETARYAFVGPDNGIFSLVCARERVSRAVHLTGKRYFSAPVSPTFHGRDVFGPVAAALSLGKAPSVFGPEIPVASLVRLELPAAKKNKGTLTGSVIHVDSFGNLITNINRSDLPQDCSVIRVRMKGISVKGLSESYSGAAPGRPAAIIGSTGLLEIALNGASASDVLGVKEGERVRVEGVLI